WQPRAEGFRAPMSDTRAATSSLEVPVALFLFRRPALTQRVFASIRAARPRRLFLVADGPRTTHPSDVEECAAARAVVAHVDWPCAVETQFAVENLGLKRRVETGLDWLFARVDEAVIVEDDCLPQATFFRFCAEMLERYRDDARVMSISAADFTLAPSTSRSSYRFSRYPLVWGWATWRRAWLLHDAAMSEWNALRAAGWI